MIFICNSEGIIQAVSPSSINQGSVSLTELILIAPVPEQSVVQAMFKLPNGLIIRPQLLTQEEYEYNLSPLEQINDALEEKGLNAWSIKINKAITQFYGTLTVSFVITGTDAIITTTETIVEINKSGTALPIPVTEGDLAEITQILQAAQTAAINAETAEENAAYSAQEAKNAENAINTVVEEFEKVLPNIRNGEGLGSIVIGTGEAYGKNSLSQGTGTIAGATAYRILSVSTFTDSIRIRIDISDGGISDREPSECIVFLEIIEGATSRNIVRFSTPEMNWYNSENGLANFFPSLLADVPPGTEINLSNSYIYISNNPYSGPVILGNNAFASGKSTRAIFDNSTALGEGTRTSRNNQLVIGEYNADSPDALLIVGNGTAEENSNAFEVKVDGTVLGSNIADDISLDISSIDYKLTISLKNQSGGIIGTAKTIDLPIETMIVNVEYDSDSKDLILILKNGEKISVPLDDILIGLPKNIEDGTGEDSVQQVGSSAIGKNSFAEGINTVAVGVFSHSSGDNTVAGSKAFTITGLNATNKTFTLDSVQGLGAGDIYSCHVSFVNGTRQFENVGTITAISGNTVTVDVFPVFAESLGAFKREDNFIDETGLDTELNTFRIIAKPFIGTRTIGYGASTVGIRTQALSKGARAEGCDNTSYGSYAHTEGTDNKAGYCAHAEGRGTTASGFVSHAEGQSTTASGVYSHAEGVSTATFGQGTHVEGYDTIVKGDYAHAEGEGGYKQDLETGTFSTTERAAAAGVASHVEGSHTHAEGNRSHAEGYATYAKGISSHAEGHFAYAQGQGAHAEGGKTKALAEYSHAEGVQTTAEGIHGSHAEGYQTTASGQRSHAEGSKTSATNIAAHAEGGGTTASGACSHAEGNGTTASHENSHTEGQGTQTSRKNQTVVGEWNADDADALFIVGNGTGDNNRSNALAVHKDGTIVGNLGGGGKLYRHTINLNKTAANSSWFNIDIITYNSSSVPITDPSLIPYNEVGVFTLNLNDTPDGERLGIALSYYNNSYQGEVISLRFVGNLEFGVLSHSSITVDIGLITITDTVTEV